MRNYEIWPTRNYEIWPTLLVPKLLFGNALLETPFRERSH